MHRTPWDVVSKAPDFSLDVWELYDTTTDWTQAKNLADEQPEKLAELQRLFLIEAARHNVFPMDDRAAERMNPEIAGRPTLVKGDHLRLYPGMVRLGENVAINVKNRSFTVTAEVVVPDGGASRARSSPRAAAPAAGRSSPKTASSASTTTTAACSVDHPVGRRARRRRAPGTGRVRLRRRRHRQGRRRDALHRRQGRRHRPRRAHARALLLLRRGPRHRAATPACRLTRATRCGAARSAAPSTWAEVALGVDDHNHLVDPEEHLAAALRHQ